MYSSSRGSRQGANNPDAAARRAHPGAAGDIASVGESVNGYSKYFDQRELMAQEQSKLNRIRLRRDGRSFTLWRYGRDELIFSIIMLDGQPGCASSDLDFDRSSACRQRPGRTTRAR